MKTYYKRGEHDMIVCKNCAAFTRVMAEHVKELQEHDSKYNPKIDYSSPNSEDVDALLRKSQEIMIEGEGGYAWTAVIHGADIYYGASFVMAE